MALILFYLILLICILLVFLNYCLFSLYFCIIKLSRSDHLLSVILLPTDQLKFGCHSTPFHFLGGLCETSSYCYLSHTGNHTSQKVISTRQKEGIFSQEKCTLMLYLSYRKKEWKLPKVLMRISQDYKMLCHGV